MSFTSRRYSRPAWNRCCLPHTPFHSTYGLWHSNPAGWWWVGVFCPGLYCRLNIERFSTPEFNLSNSATSHFIPIFFLFVVLGVLFFNLIFSPLQQALLGHVSTISMALWTGTTATHRGQWLRDRLAHTIPVYTTAIGNLPNWGTGLWFCAVSERESYQAIVEAS